MFDVFDVQLPELAPGSGFEVRGHETAFGTSDDEFVFVGGVKFARVVPASSAYGNVEAWTGSSERSGWSVLVLGPTANEAVTTDERWAAFLTSLNTVLAAHSVWRVICESDCDQRSREAMRLSPIALAALLHSVRRDHALPIAFEVTPP